MKWPARRMSSQGRKSFGMYEFAASSGRQDIIHLEIGRPYHDTPEHIKAAAKQALDAGVVHYGDLSGSSALREALASRYSREASIECDADEILITNGVTQASFAAFMASIDPGDEVIVLDPFYPQHNSKIEMAGGRVVKAPMRLQDGLFRLDAGMLEAAITAATRMIVLINPANPSGTVFTRAELMQIAEIARRHDLLVLADEVYELIVFDGRKHVSFASLPGMKERTITVSAFTKAYCMDGWRIGYAIAPREIIADLRRVTMNATTHPCVFAQEGAIAAVVGPQDCVAELLAEDQRARDLIVSSLNAMPGVECAVPEGTIYAFADVSALQAKADDLVKEIFQATGVSLESGGFYGAQSTHHLRLCFSAQPYDRLVEAMQRLAHFFEGKFKC